MKTLQRLIYGCLFLQIACKIRKAHKKNFSKPHLWRAGEAFAAPELPSPRARASLTLCPCTLGHARAGRVFLCRRPDIFCSLRGLLLEMILTQNTSSATQIARKIRKAHKKNFSKPHLWRAGEAFAAPELPSPRARASLTLCPCTLGHARAGRLFLCRRPQKCACVVYF